MRRRAEACVPSSLRPRSVLDLALPRRIKRIVQRAFRSDQIAHEFGPAARAGYQEATRRERMPSTGRAAGLTGA